jgi:hypothetical protein
MRKFEPIIPGKKRIGTTRFGRTCMTCGVLSSFGVQNPCAFLPPELMSTDSLVAMLESLSIDQKSHGGTLACMDLDA